MRIQRRFRERRVDLAELAGDEIAGGASDIGQVQDTPDNRETERTVEEIHESRN
jgi:hypothetical protein